MTRVHQLPLKMSASGPLTIDLDEECLEHLLDSFKASDWIKRNITFDDAPRHVVKAFKNMISIPSSFCDLCPQESLTVPQLLNTSLMITTEPDQIKSKQLPISQVSI
jgi:hypothetical protein